MNDIIYKCKEAVKEIPNGKKNVPFIKKMLDFMKKNKRYLAVVGMFVCFVVMLAFFTGEEFNADRLAAMNSKPISGDKYIPDAEFKVDAYEEVNSLIAEYFDAYVVADVEALEQMAVPLSEMEQSYITTMCQFYEAYENITCYTKQGLSKDSYIVSVCFDIKFADIEETAPSMVLFYVQTAEDGSLYINNLYSDFNMMYAEKPLDKDVFTAIRKYTMQDDYIDLVNEVNTAYATLIKENNEIYQISKRTIPGTRQVWEDTVYYAESTENLEGTENTESTEGSQTTEQKPSESQKPSETPQPSESQTPSETPQPSESQTPSESQQPSETPEPVVKKIKIVNVRNKVNIRAKADADSTDIGDAKNGEVFVKLGEVTNSKGEKWIKIQFGNNKVGYIKSNYTKDITE